MYYYLKKSIRYFCYKNILTKKFYEKMSKIRSIYDMRLDDITFAKKYYKETTGKKLNIEDPQTFDEKLWWLKFHNNNPLLKLCSDKFLVRNYVKECGYENILTHIYKVWDDVDDIKIDDLPETFYLKANKGSGGNVACHNKRVFDLDKAKKKLKQYLKPNSGLRLREYNYRDITPKIICEEILTPKNKEPLIDYKFYCFYGKVRLLLRCEGVANENGEHSNDSDVYQNFFDLNFERINVSEVGYKEIKDKIKKPDHFNDMLKCASVLSNPFPFCRVDLYNIDGEIYFGELTFYDGGGVHIYKPENFNKLLGSYLDLDGLE